MNSFIVFVPMGFWPVYSLDTILDWIERKLHYVPEDKVQDYVGEWINSWIITPFQEY
jgi:hypothetical protein